jgi:hypothetical protein
MANFRNACMLGDDISILGNPWKPSASLFGNSAGRFGLPDAPLGQGFVPNDPRTLSVLLPLTPPNDVRIDPKLGSLSPLGWQFIYVHETLAKVSNRLYWPHGASGITLGAGYDMKERSAATITADMKGIGLPDATAQAIAKAAGMAVGKKVDGKVLTDKDMKKYAQDHRDDVNLTDAQQMALLKLIGGHYETMVRNALKVPLAQYEFDSLVSFAYNPGGQWRHTTRYLNQGKRTEAMNAIRAANRSGGAVLPTLTRRRTDEVKLFLQGKYEKDGHTISLG